MEHTILKKWIMTLVIALVYFNTGIHGMEDLESEIKAFDDFEFAFVNLQLKQGNCFNLVFKKAITLTDLQGEFFTSACECIAVNGNEVKYANNEDVLDTIQDKNDKMFILENTGWILEKNSTSLIWRNKNENRVWYKKTTKKSVKSCCSCKNGSGEKEQITFKKL